MNPKKYYVHVRLPPIPGHIAKEGKTQQQITQQKSPGL